MYVYLDIKSLYPHLKVNWNMLMCKICIARRLVVDIFPWCNANFVPFPSGTLVARRMRNGRIDIVITIIFILVTIILYKHDKQPYSFKSTHRMSLVIVLVCFVCCCWCCCCCCNRFCRWCCYICCFLIHANKLIKWRMLI